MRKETRFLAKAIVYVADEAKQDNEAKLKDLSLNG
jgi:hypothetical protein